MSQTTTGDGAGRRDDAPVRQGSASEPCQAIGSGPSGSRRFGVVWSVAGTIFWVVALVFLASGGW